MKRAISLLLIASAGWLLVAAARPAPPPLSRWAGDYPFARKNGVTFLTHPRVVRAVGDAVLNDTIEVQVLKQGVSTPIVTAGPILVSRTCLPHACNIRDWAIAVLTPAGPASVCYHDQALTDDEGRWFVDGRLIARSKGGCYLPESGPKLPAAVSEALMRAR